MGGADRVYPRVTIDALPDNVLVEIFEIHLDKDDADEIPLDHDHNRWQKLVHVCRRWRCIVFASPRRLDLVIKLGRSTKPKALDIWPALPIVIWIFAIESKEQATNIITALRERDRVRRIYYDDSDCGDCYIQDSLLDEFVAIDEPFPALTSLDLFSCVEDAIALPDSFLGGSAPLLRSLELERIPYPSIGKLLSSTTNLVRLSLWNIPRSGYIAPETVVPLLSMLPGLKSLELGLEHPRSQAQQASRHPPPLTRVVFPSLTYLMFRSDIEYLEDILSQIEAPILNECFFQLFNQLVFDTPLVGHFIRRTETFMKINRARVEFSRWSVEVKFWGHNDYYEGGLKLRIACKPLDWQLSAVVQISNSFLSFLAPLESLAIDCGGHYPQSECEAIQWREFLRLFTSVKDMTLKFQDSVRFVAPALQELAGERTTEVLPALQNLFLQTSPYQQPLNGPVKKVIEQFSATRQHPVTIHYETR